MPREGTETTIHHPFHIATELLDLEIRCPERGRKLFFVNEFQITCDVEFGNKMPREGTETEITANNKTKFFINLEIRCPERGRKRCFRLYPSNSLHPFGNKMPREGTETFPLRGVPELYC